MPQIQIPPNYNFKKRAEHCFKLAVWSALATTDGNDVWNSPLWLVKDKDWNMYFRSKVDSKHVNNVMKNKSVAIAIYDSKQIDSIAGLQISGYAQILNTKKEVEDAMKYYHPGKSPLTHKEYTDKDAEFMLVKIIPTHIYIFDQESLGDKRVEINIEKLRS